MASSSPASGFAAPAAGGNGSASPDAAIGNGNASPDAVMESVSPEPGNVSMEGITGPSLASDTGNTQGIPPVVSVTPSVMDEDGVVPAQVADNRPRPSWNDMEEESPTPVHPSPVSMSDIAEPSPAGNIVGPADDEQGSTAPMQTEPVIASGRPASEAGGTDVEFQVIESRMDECDTVASMSVVGTEVGATAPRRWPRPPSDAGSADLHTTRLTSVIRPSPEVPELRFMPESVASSVI